MNKKLLSFITFIFVSILFVSNTLVVNAASFGTVKDISNEDSVWNKNDDYSVSITGNDTSDVLVKYGIVKLNTLSGNGSRPDGYAWLGFNITRPTGATSKVKVNGKQTDDYSDGDYYFGINKDKLIEAVKNGTNIKYVYEFDWENDGEYEQTVTIIIDPSKVTLTANSKDGETLWSPGMVAQYAPLDEEPNTGDIFSPVLAVLISIALTSGIYTFAVSRK